MLYAEFADDPQTKSIKSTCKFTKSSAKHTSGSKYTNAVCWGTCSTAIVSISASISTAICSKFVSTTCSSSVQPQLAEPSNDYTQELKMSLDVGEIATDIENVSDFDIAYDDLPF